MAGFGSNDDVGVLQPTGLRIEEVFVWQTERAQNKPSVIGIGVRVTAIT